jgi:restriction system protein
MNPMNDGSKLDWLPTDSATPALIEQWRRHSRQAVGSVVIEVPTGHITAEGQSPSVIQYPEILLQAAVVSLGSSIPEGHIVEAVAIPWFEILKQLEQDPDFLFKVPWRKLEEIVAGAYVRAGWPDVVLTPRSGDRGRDVIATRPGVCSVRIVDQVKAYKKGHLVTADEVRSMLGVLQVDPNVSKGLVTTTSLFAPGIEDDSGLRAFMPFRLELKNGDQLREWFATLLRGTADIQRAG